MLEVGADPNIRNDSGSTALLWAIEDIDKMRLLLDHGANVNSASDFGRTPLMLATALGRSEQVVRLLLDHGAVTVQPALAASAYHGNAASVKMLLATGFHDNGLGAAVALRQNCDACFEAINSDRPISSITGALLRTVPPAGPGDSQAILKALKFDGDVNAKDPNSRSVIMRAAISEIIAPETMQLLIDRGADVHGRDVDGLTALDYARRVGRKPIVDILVKAGATTSASTEPVAALVTNNNPRAAVERSLPLLATDWHRVLRERRLRLLSSQSAHSHDRCHSPSARIRHGRHRRATGTDPSQERDRSGSRCDVTGHIVGGRSRNHSRLHLDGTGCFRTCTRCDHR